MKTLLNNLSKNQKINFIKTEVIESLDDDVNYKQLTLVLKTKRNLFEWAKSIYIRPSEKEGFYNLEVLMDFDPKETLLKEIYNDFKTEEWVKASYGHEKKFMKVIIEESNVIKIVNWLYSKIN